MRGLGLVLLAGCGRWGFTNPKDAPTGTGTGDGDAASDGIAIADAARDGASDSAIDAPALGPCTKLAISDDFNDGTRAAIWTLLANNPVNVAETGGSLQIMLASSGGAHYGGYDSASMVDFRNHCMNVTIVQTPTNEANVEMDFELRTAANTSTGFTMHSGVVDPFVNTGTFMSFGAVTYDPSVQKVILIREDNGTMTWETSPDGTTFTVVATEPTPLDVSAVTVVLEAGTYASAASPGTAIYDDFDLP